jgi:hypothetical protein
MSGTLFHIGEMIKYAKDSNSKERTREEAVFF